MSETVLLCCEAQLVLLLAVVVRIKVTLILAEEGG